MAIEAFEKLVIGVSRELAASTKRLRYAKLALVSKVYKQEKI